ncbi:hypothetical protein ROSI111154_07870 [Rouxiella silvae]
MASGINQKKITCFHFNQSSNRWEMKVTIPEQANVS